MSMNKWWKVLTIAMVIWNVVLTREISLLWQLGRVHTQFDRTVLDLITADVERIGGI